MWDAYTCTDMERSLKYIFKVKMSSCRITQYDLVDIKSGMYFYVHKYKCTEKGQDYKQKI